MSNVPDGAQLSDDGNYWWDGNQWQPVAGQDGDQTATQPDPSANPSFVEYTTDADTPFDDGSLQQVDSSACPAEDPNRYCVYKGVKFNTDSVVCMDDHILHTCNMYQESDGVYRASWSRTGPQC